MCIDILRDILMSLCSGGTQRFCPFLVAFWYRFYINGSNLNKFHLLHLIHIYILRLNINMGGTLLVFFTIIIHNIFLRSLEIRFLLQRTSYQCSMCYHHPFQHTHKGNLYLEISQPVLSKGQYWNSMQLLHQSTSIN